MTANRPMELRWSQAWADVVGADGPVISDLLGRVIPTLTDEQRDAVRRAHRELHPTMGRMAHGVASAWKVANGAGLRAALACAIQSADRALRTHITGEVNSDDWHRWVAIENPVHGLMAALVVRHHHPPMGTLAAAWEQAMGPLPALDDLTIAGAGEPDRCLGCDRPKGARYVTEADAARYARNLWEANAAAVRWAEEREAAARRALRNGLRDRVRRSELIEALDACLHQPGVAVPPKARRHIEAQFAARFGLRPAAGNCGACDD